MQWQLNGEGASHLLQRPLDEHHAMATLIPKAGLVSKSLKQGSNWDLSALLSLKYVLCYEAD